MSAYMYTHSSHEDFPSFLTDLPLRVTEHVTKTPPSGTRGSLLSCGSWLSKRLLKQQTVALSCFPQTETKGKSLLRKINTLWTQNPEDLKWIRSKNLLSENQLSWYQKAPRKLPEEGSIQQPYPVMTPMDHNNGQDGTIILRVQQQHTYFDGDEQLLIGRKAFSTRGKSCMVLEIQPGPVISQILEENLQPSLYKINIIPNYIVNIYHYTHR